MKEFFLGIDVGSVSTNLVLMNPDKSVEEKIYIRTAGRPMDSVRNGFLKLKAKVGEEFGILGAGTTGSGRQLAAAMTGADVLKNEITAHGVAALQASPKVQTILEIGGQDSKIILIRDGIIYDFAMNTVCAAGTGSFLDRQAQRLNIPLQELGHYALRSSHPARIAGRCAVFAESDMIHKQQEGQPLEDILSGLCHALVRNYLANLAKGKQIQGPVLFQGGVAANEGIVQAFEEELGIPVTIPEYYDVMGAWGAAILAQEQRAKTGGTSFCGVDAMADEFSISSFECEDCPNRCNITRMQRGEQQAGCWGSRCGKY